MNGLPFLDKDGVIFLWAKIKTLVSGKVDKVEGKGLSSNDFTNDEKTKLEELENYTLPVATATMLGGVKAGSGVTINEDGVISTNSETVNVTWANITNKPDVALKSDLTTVYRYKGSVINFASLPMTDVAVGDTYNVESNGKNYAWTGEAWDDLGGTFEIAAITNEEIDAITEG